MMILFVRIFIAIELPEELKEKISVLAEKVTAGLAIRLVEKENLHLTLAFLGEVPGEKIQEITGVLREMKGVGRIHLRLESWEPFPSKKKPFGIWINVEGETGKLFSLYKKIIDGLLAKNFVLERNSLKFSPHITVGRMKSGGVRSMGTVRLEENFTTGKVTLFSSELTEKGPKFTKIGEFEVQ